MAYFAAVDALYIFLLTTPPLPRSTLFPYTTLFRSLGGVEQRPDVLGRRFPHQEVAHLLEGRRGRLAIASRPRRDRKSTRLNSSHVKISYAVFCLKKKKLTTTDSLSSGRTTTSSLSP